MHEWPDRHRGPATLRLHFRSTVWRRSPPLVSGLGFPLAGWLVFGVVTFAPLTPVRVAPAPASARSQLYIGPHAASFPKPAGQGVT